MSDKPQVELSADQKALNCLLGAFSFGLGLGSVVSNPVATERAEVVVMCAFAGAGLTALCVLLEKLHNAIWERDQCRQRELEKHAP